MDLGRKGGTPPTTLPARRAAGEPRSNSSGARRVGCDDCRSVERSSRQASRRERTRGRRDPDAGRGRGHGRAAAVGRPAHVGRESGRRGRGHHPPRGHRPPRRRPRPARGRPGHGQDAARPRDRPQPRPRHGAGPGHARPAAVRRHRLEPVRADRAPLRRGPGVHEPPAGRRDQPRDAADPERAARGDAGAPGVRRGDDAPPAGPVPRDRDPEPGRVRGHVRAAAGAARPVPAARRGRLSRPARRAPDRPPPPGRRPTRWTRSSP